MCKAGSWALGDKIKRHHPLQMALREIPMRYKCKKTYLLTGHWAMGMRDASGGSHREHRVGTFPKCHYLHSIPNCHVA